MMWKCIQRACIHVSAVSLKKTPLHMKGKSAADQRWLMRQLNDPFVKAAHAQNYRCRSAFKLIEIDDKYRLLKPGLSVIDCGAAPGAWSQVAVQRVNSAGESVDLPKGSVIGIDILRIAPLDGAQLLSNHDITEPSTHMALERLLPEARADVILSDMAPNASGLRDLDHERLVTMCLSVLDLADKVLRPGGSLICKYWDGALAHKLQQRLSSMFQDVRTVKPRASRKESAELFFLARMFKMR
ncbi:rRNA methyltransferase 2, mitochondrial [Labeo rohita]|uniref:rRNA methyltransferase 2, mitochondrial n=2 Tax=Labeo rohita TaxID=84645 RepID=A0ABQ8MTD2_LABRO|nr:rRNA methyltransferase 2, mitochondrial isoform X2 [Labeo rohita]KAI2666100.1 rRNA methyltransferase 2, mitochondrial [Labeo rohita]